MVGRGPPDRTGIVGPGTDRLSLGTLEQDLAADLVPDLGVREVPDPYFGNSEGFEKVLELTERASEALLARIMEARASG